MRAKTNKIKSLMDKSDAKAFVEFYKKSGHSFNVSITNYTIRVKSGRNDSYFYKNDNATITFAAHQKVKQDVLKREIPNINKNQLKYFEHAFEKPMSYESVCCIDLKSAYATVLM